VQALPVRHNADKRIEELLVVLKEEYANQSFICDANFFPLCAYLQRKMQERTTGRVDGEKV